ncbi:hypothetical protein A2U01_0069484, partial [Trifolium medium]|nr:hypothetical protein [Trifolium medium]
QDGQRWCDEDAVSPPHHLFQIGAVFVFYVHLFGDRRRRLVVAVSGHV